MKRYWSILKKILIGWGILSLIGVIVLSALVAYQFNFFGDTSSNKTVSKDKVRYVLNWCGLGEERTEEVVHSYISSRSLTGDHLDAHAIRISHVDENDFGKRWFRGDKASGVLNDALNFVETWLPSNEIPWFLNKEELRTPEIYIYPATIYFHGIHPTAIEIIFVRPKDKMVYFFSAKT